MTNPTGTSTRRIVTGFATTLVAGSALALTACSHDSSTATESASATMSAAKSSTAASSSSAAPSSSTAPSSSAAAPASASKSATASGSANNAGDTIPLVADGSQSPQQGPSPVQGQTASTEDVNGIKQTLGMIMDDKVSMKQYFSTVKSRTCKEQLDKHPNEFSDEAINSMPDTPMNQVPGGGDLPEFKSLSDVKVNGNQASATVNTVFDNKNQTSTMLFSKEGGVWKLCS